MLTGLTIKMFCILQSPAFRTPIALPPLLFPSLPTPQFVAYTGTRHRCSATGVRMALIALAFVLVGTTAHGTDAQSLAIPDGPVIGVL
ncbi:unnamed protein product [Tilletia controversa]|nr:unnamed protein product [Tilletia controversa]